MLLLPIYSSPSHHKSPFMELHFHVFINAIDIILPISNPSATVHAFLPPSYLLHLTSRRIHPLRMRHTIWSLRNCWSMTILSNLDIFSGPVRRSDLPYKLQDIMMKKKGSKRERYKIVENKSSFREATLRSGREIGKVENKSLLMYHDVMTRVEKVTSDEF